MITKSSIIWRPYCRALVVSRIHSTAVSESSSSGSLSTFSHSRSCTVNSAALRVLNFWMSASKSQNTFQKIHSLMQACSLSFLDSHQISETASCQSFFQHPFTFMDLVHPETLCIYCAVSYAVGLSAFTDWNKGLLLSCIQDTAEDAASVSTLECYDDSLVNWQWEWGCFVAKILNFGIWMFKTKILSKPWDSLSTRMTVMLDSWT